MCPAHCDATERWLLAAFAQTSALLAAFAHASALLATVAPTAGAVDGLHDVLETLVLNARAPPPLIAALRMRLGRVGGATAPEPAPERRKREHARRPGGFCDSYARETALWMPGMQARVNGYNAAVFALRALDASLARRYVDEPPARWARQCCTVLASKPRDSVSNIVEICSQEPVP